MTAVLGLDQLSAVTALEKEHALRTAGKEEELVTDDRSGDLSKAYEMLKTPHRALEYYQERLAIARRKGDRLGEARALGDLGNAHSGWDLTSRP